MKLEIKVPLPADEAGGMARVGDAGMTFAADPAVLRVEAALGCERKAAAS